MSSNNYSRILIYYLPPHPRFFPKTLHNFPSLWFKRKCSYICELKVLCGHFLHQWTIQIICSSGVRAWKSQWPTSCLPGPSSNPLTHGSAPSPSETGKFLDLRLFFFFLSNTSKVLAKKKKKSHLLHHPHNPPFLFPNPIFLFSRCHPHRCLAQNLLCGITLILPWHSSPCYSLEL